MEWFDKIQTVGITGATSTPQWLMEKVKNHIEKSIAEITINKVVQPSIIHEIV
jgi:4-hydroxy-3-methylbut-2-enyl diphosphate reductase IspH